MKVVVQNGCNHGLSRTIVERVLAHIPAPWRSNVNEVLICSSTSAVPVVRFHAQHRSVSVNGPDNSEGVADVLTELLIALSLVAERGELPSRISKSIRRNQLNAANAILLKAGLRNQDGSSQA